MSTGIDKHGRTIADAFIPTGNEEEIHLNSRLLSDGMAYVYPEFVGRCPNAAVVKQAERTTKDSATGVWANPTARIALAFSYWCNKGPVNYLSLAASTLRERSFGPDAKGF